MTRNLRNGEKKQAGGYPTKVAHLGQIDRDLDHLDPKQPLRDVVQDLYSTDQTQGAGAIFAIYHAD